MTQSNRRQFLCAAAATAAAAAHPAFASAAAGAHATPRRDPLRTDADPAPLSLSFAVKIGMVGGSDSLEAKFARVKELGYDGIELDSPSGLSREEVANAHAATGLPVHGVVCSTHWGTRLSDPNPDTRKKAIENLAGAIRDAKAYGGSSVLLVPGRVANAETENHDHVWQRSIEGIRAVLPLAASLGIHLLIENVWNGFCYRHDGPSDQTAEQLADYLDAIHSPWVGAYFDIGNHQKYGKPAEWIRTLGRRIVKLDVKDWGRENGWAKIGDGDVDWTDVRRALREIQFTGWCTAEVGGGDRARLAEVHANMTRTLRAHP